MIGEITKEVATKLRHGQVLYHRVFTNKDGSALRVRVNGKCQTWKTRPEAFRLPIKHGLYQYGEITQDNAAAFSTVELV